MKAAPLLLIALALFTLGARYFVKFLRLSVFDAAPVPGRKKLTAKDILTHLTTRPGFAHQASVVTGGTTIIGAALGASWGWAPIYLWVVAGAMVIGSIYAIGSSWLTREFPDHGATEVTARFLGPVAPIPLLLLLFVALLILVPMMAIMLGDLLATYPTGAGAFIYVLPAAAAVGALQRRGSVVSLLMALNLFIIAVAIGGNMPIRVFGDIGFSPGDASFQLNARVLWAVAILFTAATACRIPQRSLAQPMGSFALVGLLVVLLTLMISLFIVAPEVSAPAHTSGVDLPSVFPWICVIATGGALSFFHGLTNDEGLGRHGDAAAQHFAFSRSMLDAVLAIVVILVIVSVNVDSRSWIDMNATWNLDKPLHMWVSGFVLGGAELLSIFGLPRETMAGAIVMVIVCLGLLTIETALRTLHYLVGEGVSRTPLDSVTPRTQWFCTFGIVTIFTLFAHGKNGGIFVLPILGTASLYFTATLLFVIAIAVADIGRPWKAVAFPAMILAGIATCGSAATVWQAATEGAPLKLTLSVFVLILGLWTLVLAARGMASVNNTRQLTRSLL